ncbi:hypothetical protein [Amycolatopsis sp. TNS106]|nr:hypothetical protein [Amycolatopsis sp. TNS106]
MHDFVEALPEIITALGAAITTIIAAGRGRSLREDADDNRSEREEQA